MTEMSYQALLTNSCFKTLGRVLASGNDLHVTKTDSYYNRKGKIILVAFPKYFEILFNSRKDLSYSMGNKGKCPNF